MTQKLYFSIEDANIISENPDSNFAVLSLDFFASGKNLHDMYVSEDTLIRTAETIKNCPLVWAYDEKLDDVYTHDKSEIPCGFVPENAQVKTKKLSDGRTMLSVVAYVWKRYTGQLLNFFKRDGGKKPVSVEMTVSRTKRMESGLLELLDFKYEGITILGSFVTPAIPSANASVLSFSQIKKEYDEAFEQDFHYVSASTKIPREVKENVQKGLEIIKEYGKATSVDLAFAKQLIKKEEISNEDASRIVQHFTDKGLSKMLNMKETNPYVDEYISYLLWGGATPYKWAKSVIEKEEKENAELDYSEVVTFPYKSKEDINPALKGISPPISVAQANEIARQADAIGTDGKVNGWAVAISSFKKTHVVKDGKWVKKSENMEMAMDNEKQEDLIVEETIEMAEDTAKDEEKETPAKEKAETPAEQKKEEEKGIEKKFEFPKNMSMEKMSEFFSDDGDEDDIKMAKDEVTKGEFANPSVVMAGMFAKMCKMSKMLEKMAEDNKVYMQENEELKKFKAELETSQKNFEVNKTLTELAAKVVIPDEARDEMLAEAEKYSFANIDAWKTYCKAKSFDFAVKDKKSDDVIKIGMPFTTATKKQDDLWS